MKRNLNKEDKNLPGRKPVVLAFLAGMALAVVLAQTPVAGALLPPVIHQKPAVPEAPDVPDIIVPGGNGQTGDFGFPCRELVGHLEGEAPLC